MRYSRRLRDWVAAQQRAGRSRDDISAELRALDWHPASIQRLFEHCADPRPPADGASLPALCRQIPRASATVDGRELKVLMNLHHPRVTLFADALSREECEALIDEARPNLRRSEVVVYGDEDGAASVNYSRTSETTFLDPRRSELCRRVQERVAALIGWPDACFESLQVLRYSVGAEFTPHHDYFDEGSRELKGGGQRIATVLLYLNSPQRGGSTLFSDVELEVQSHQGNALFFSYAHPALSESLHAGTPVLEGEKWIGTIFVRQHAIARPKAGGTAAAAAAELMAGGAA